VGGNREIVEDGASGLLFDPGDGAGLAAAILKLLEDSALRRRLAREGRRRAEALFSAERHAREIERIYMEVLVSS
jgi:glycosyltransferase involved in cell wall biosynthesis